MDRRSFLRAGALIAGDTGVAHLTQSDPAYLALFNGRGEESSNTPYPLPRGLRQTDLLAGDGGATYGPFGFKVFDTNDVKAFVRLAGEDTLREVTSVVTKVSGESLDFFIVTFPVPLPVDARFVIAGERLGERYSGVRKGSQVDLTAMEKEFSKLTATEQELRRDIGRALKVDFGQEEQILPLPDTNSVLGWSGGRLVNVPNSEQSITDARAAAEAALAAANAGFVFDKVSDFRAASIPLVLDFVDVAGQYVPGDGGGHRKVRIAPPGVVKPWHDQSADGTWWSTASDNPRVFGARGDGLANDTAAIDAADSLSGRVVLPGGDYFLDANSVDLRRIRGAGKLLLSSGTKIAAEKLVDRGDIAQRYYTEIKNTTLNSVTQSIAVHKGKLYRSQERSAPDNAYAYTTIVDITQMDLPAGGGRSRSTIDYTNDAGAQTQNYVVPIQGFGHGDGIALFTDGAGVDWMYGKCSAPPGSLSPETECNGFVKFPWRGAATAQEPAGAVFYRNLQGVGNANFGMSSDGKWLLFVQRDTYVNGAITLGNGETTTYRVVVHNRAAIEAAGPVNAPNIPPVTKFVIVPHRLSDTIYAPSGITSDGKYIYIIFSGARVVGKTFLHVHTMGGDFVKSIITSGIRAESVDTYVYGKNGWLPAFYETEGLTIHEDKLLTASRYLFVSGSPVVRWRGSNYVYMGTAPSSGNLPIKTAYWAPTKAATTAGAYNPTTLYTRGTVIFHHYVTAFVTGGVYGSEEFAIDVDPYNHNYTESSFNGIVSARSDYSICYRPLNTPWTCATYTARINGEHYFYNGVKLANGEHSTNHGAKIAVNDTDIRFQNVSGLADSGAIVLATSANSMANNILLYGGESTLAARFAASASVFYGVIRPEADNSRTNGQASFRWSVVYAGTGTINTSDERLKDFSNLAAAERAAALEISRNIRKYKFLDAVEKKGENDARWHFGVAAQQVGATLERHGLDPNRYAFFCHDTWESLPELWDEWPATYDNDGNVTSKGGSCLTQQARDAGDRYGIRYDELHSFVIDALVEHIDTTISAIHARLAALEA